MAEAPNHHQEGSFPGRETSQGHQGHQGLPPTVAQVSLQRILFLGYVIE